VAAAPTLDATAIVTRAVDGFVRPAYHEFHLKTTALADATKSLCAAPSAPGFDSARAAFGETVKAWSEVETIRFGPVTEQNRLDRIFYWPDRKSIGLKQVQATLAAKDATAIDPLGLAQKSVAMQGLGALEFVLFGTDAETLSGASDPYRCAYGAAIATNLDGMAGDIDAAWAAKDGFAALWEARSAGNALYRTGDEALTELLGVFVSGLEMIRDVRVNGFLGETPDKDKPKQAVFWRSGNTAASLAANMAGLNALFEASGLGKTLPPDESWIAQSIGFEFGNALNAAKASEGPIEEVLSDPKRRDKLGYFAIVTSSLSELFGVRLSGALGLTAGFSSLDGD
jgi:predicted lipoprotein